jgi:hypothetical protein
MSASLAVSVNTKTGTILIQGCSLMYYGQRIHPSTHGKRMCGSEKALKMLDDAVLNLKPNKETNIMTTGCRNYKCPYKTDGSCNHNIWRNGLKCKGNESGYHYRSQIQAIVCDYKKECEIKGVKPMPRNIYLEG